MKKIYTYSFMKFCFHFLSTTRISHGNLSLIRPTIDAMDLLDTSFHLVSASLASNHFPYMEKQTKEVLGVSGNFSKFPPNTSLG